MDRTTLARKLREALFDHIETGRRDALQDSAIDSLFERVLASCSVLDLDVGRLHSTQRAILGTWIDQQQSTCQCEPDTASVGSGPYRVLCQDGTAYRTWLWVDAVMVDGKVIKQPLPE